MHPPQEITPGKRRHGFFLRGLAVLLPTVLTLAIFATAWQFLERYVTGPINAGVYGALEGNGAGWKMLRSMGIEPYAREFIDEEALPPELVDRIEEFGGYGSMTFSVVLFAWRTQNESFLRDFDALAIDHERLRSAVVAKVHPAIGTVLTLAAVLTFGYLASGFLGRRLTSGMDGLLMHIPLVRSVYPTAKQLTEFFFADSKLEFDTVVAVPYPSADIWSLGFVTGNGLRSLNSAAGIQLVTIFVPTSPMPMTGFMIFVEPDKIRPLDLTVEEALRITVTGGVIVPPAEQVSDLEPPDRQAA